MASTVFFLSTRGGFWNRAQTADLLIDLQQGTGQLLKPAELLDFSLGFALRDGSGKSLGNGFALAFESETVVGSMAGVVGLVAMATGISTAAASGSDGAWAEVTQAGNLQEQG
jgi:hypothetical protein